jgi:hypothetical protein
MSGDEEVSVSWWHRYWRPVAAGLVALAALSLLAAGPAALALGVRDELRRQDAAAEAARHRLGTEVRDGPATFVVHSVHCGAAEGETTNGQLCEVTIGVRNDGPEELAVPGLAQMLYAAAGARLRPATEEPEPFGKIGPGQAATATIPFDVPSQSVITHVEVHATPYTRGQAIALDGPPLPLLSAPDRASLKPGRGGQTDAGSGDARPRPSPAHTRDRHQRSRTGAGPR